MTTEATLSGPEKAAILILSLPEEGARQLLARMDEEEIDRILEAVSRIDHVAPEVQAQVLEEFRERIEGQSNGVLGGTARTLEIIENLLPAARAERLRARFRREDAPIAWALHPHTPAFIAETIAAEDPQTIALILSQIPTRKGSAVIAALPEALRPEVVRRLAIFDAVPADLVADVAAGLEDLFVEHARTAATPGPALAAELIAQMRRTEGEEVLGAVERADGTVAEEIRRRLFTFEHLVKLDDRGLRTLLQRVPIDELALALKTASEALRLRIDALLPARAREALADELENQGPRRLSEVEAKQREIVDLARRLAEQGELSLGADPDDVWV